MDNNDSKEQLLATINNNPQQRSLTTSRICEKQKLAKL